MKKNKRIRVAHLISGDLWAGAEAQAAVLLSWLTKNPSLKLSAIIFNEGRLSQKLKCLGIPVYVFEEKRHNPFWLFMKVKQVLSKDKVQILHTHRYKENIIGGLASLFSGVPYRVKTVHGLDEPFRGIKKMKANFYNSLDKWTTKFTFHKIIAVSSHIGERLKKQHPGPPIVWIHNCVDLQKIKVSKSKIEVKRNLGVKEDSPLIGTAGRLVPVKGLDYLLKATTIMLRKFPDLKVLIIGEGADRKNLERLASELGVETKVTFAGQREDVYDLISAMDLFILPSLSEGIPMALLETLALGVPVVASNVGGITEVLVHGQTGFLVPARDETALADACLYLLKQRETAHLLADRGRKLVQGKFSAERMAQKVTHLYSSLIS
ncbi:MAG: glycosyltransferase [Candidatus Zixiibacteriota bacterium]